MIALASGHNAIMRDLNRWLLHAAIDPAEGIKVKGRATQFFIRVPVGLGYVILKTPGDMRGCEVPAEALASGCDHPFLPARGALFVQGGPFVFSSCGDGSIGCAGFRETIGTFHALRFELNGAAVRITALIAKIRSGFGIIDEAMGKRW